MDQFETPAVLHSAGKECRFGFVTTRPSCSRTQCIEIFLSRTWASDTHCPSDEHFDDWRVYLAFVLGGQLDKITDVCVWSQFGLMLGHLAGIGNCHSQEWLLERSTGGVHEGRCWIRKEWSRFNPTRPQPQPHP